MTIVVIGAGPAGLTAAYRLAKSGHRPLVIESDDVVGGIARTVHRDGWRFDIGGHRFFTKVPVVEDLWFEILPADDWLLRPRHSRILYGGKYYDYPLRAIDVFRNLGIFDTVACVASYLWCRLRPPANQSHFEGWVAARFGRRLYRKFFRTYTEKVWGVPGSEIKADWAAQRIKSLSLWEAARDALRLKRRTSNTAITSLIAEFHYPRLGPGMLWERCQHLVEDAGGTVQLEAKVVEILLEEARGATAVTVQRPGNRLERQPCSTVLSSMPLSELVQALRPSPPPAILAAAGGLRYRDFVLVALIVPERVSFPGQWIYVHTPGVEVGRIQNFAEWSPELVQPGTSCLGFEYFVNEGDADWNSSDSELIARAAREMEQLGLAAATEVQSGYVVRMPKAYPMYDDTYREHVDTIRTWLQTHAPNIYPVGRNGMHRYNNQDHSMLTAMLTVENMIDGAQHDIWSVNVDDDYHEEIHDQSTRVG